MCFLSADLDLRWSVNENLSPWYFQVLVALNQGEDKSAISPDSLFQVLELFRSVQICTLMWYFTNFFSGYLESCAKISRLSAAGIHQFSTPFSKMTLCRMPTSFFGTCWIVSTLNSFNFSLVPNLTKPGWMNSDLPGQFLTVRYRVMHF